MLKDLDDTNRRFTEEKRKLIEEHRARWQAVNYGETDSNLAKFKRQAEIFGRIKYWQKYLMYIKKQGGLKTVVGKKL